MLPRLLLYLAILSTAARAETYLIENGQPRAEIVLAEPPLRTTQLAATELQAYLQKITGAQLPIVPAPTGHALPIYLGRSPFTDARHWSDDDLPHGAFRITSGDPWLALFGRDREFTPREPWPRRATDLPRVMAEWDKLTGAKWDLDMFWRQTFKMRSPSLGVWEQDERGSLNAVYEYLRTLGVRWYLPGPLGEIVPQRATLPLPVVDRTVRPDFALRYQYLYGRRFNSANDPEETLWQLRLGLSQAPELVGTGYFAHGTVNVHSRDEVKAAHPEYYTLTHGQRDTKDRGKPCLSSPGLLADNVRYVRACFDLLGMPVVSVMPADGYTGMCECDLCRGKETAERGAFGRFSDYTWGYVNQVAQEVYKTNPNQKIVCVAYGASVLPPLKIDHLSPNLLVCIAQNRASLADPERRAWMEGIRKAWLAKLSPPPANLPLPLPHNLPPANLPLPLPLNLPLSENSPSPSQNPLLPQKRPHPPNPSSASTTTTSRPRSAAPSPTPQPTSPTPSPTTSAPSKASPSATTSRPTAPRASSVSASTPSTSTSPPVSGGMPARTSTPSSPTIARICTAPPKPR